MTGANLGLEKQSDKVIERMNRKKNRIKGASWQFWIIIALPLLYILIFSYIPMGGLLMAFEDFSPRRGFFGSEWVGLKWFEQFLTMPKSLEIIWNTLMIGLYSLVASFPIPIILAIALNEVGNAFFRKTVQMVTYAPYFISTTVLIGLMMQLMDTRIGIINRIITMLGGNAVNFFGEQSIFHSLYVWSGVWQTTGYSSIIFFAALSGVSKELQEAAIVDGASRIKRIWHVDIPAILPTVIIMFIFNCGSIINIGYEKIFLMQNDMNAGASEVISTYMYKVGLKNGNYGLSTAVGLFNSLVSFTLLIIVNTISKKLTETSLW